MPKFKEFLYTFRQMYPWKLLTHLFFRCSIFYMMSAVHCPNDKRENSKSRNEK